MKLTFDQLAAATLGAAYLTEEADGTHFHRFPPAQEEIYARREHPMPIRASASAGIALSFRTDSRSLTLKGGYGEAWSRDYCALDVTVDGRYVGSVNNFSHLEPLEGNYADVRCARDPFEKTFDLGPGEKTVKLYFPWSAALILRELALSEGSSFTPVRPKQKILFYGDSITQGYDALRPMNSYASRVADALGMEQVNRAVGSEVFSADVTDLAEDMDPAVVVVAWGTNDWGIGTREHLLENAPKVFQGLRDRYPHAAMYAIVPIWRGDRDEIRQYGAFAQMREDVRQAAEAVEGITVVDGYDLVPHEPKFFGDLRLHPSDEGFRLYAQRLYKLIKKETDQ